MKKILITLILLTTGSFISLYHVREDLAVYWIEWSSFQRHITWQDKQLGFRKPFLSKSVTRLDPEAAAIAEWTLHQNFKDFKDIEHLSEMAIRFPGNQYFLYALACRIADQGYTDPQLIDCLADRLLELDPKNSKYYFLKAWAAFYDWRPDHIEKTIEYLELCFRGHQNDPYSLYKSRIAALIEKEKPLVYLSVRSGTWLSNDLYLSSKLIRSLLEYTQDLIVNGRAEEAMRIHDRLQHIAETSIPQTIQQPWQLWMSFSGYNYGLSSETPQKVELKWMQLTPKRAKQNRMQMLGWRSLDERIRQLRHESKTQARTDHRGYILHLAPPGAHCFEMTLASMVALFSFAALGLILKMQKSRMPFYSWIGASVFFAAWFALCRFGDYTQMHQFCGSGHYTYDYMLMSSNVLIVLAALKEFGWMPAVLLLVTGTIAAIAIPFCLRKPSSKKFIFSHMASIVFIFLLWLELSKFSYIVPVMHVFMLWLAVPLLCLWPPEEGKPYTNLFSRTNEGRQFRTRCVTVCSYLLVLHFSGFGLLGRSALIKTSAAVKEERTDNTWTAFTPPRFQITSDQYSNLLHHLKTEKLGDAGLVNQLNMVEPEDISAVLTSIKENRITDPNFRSCYGMMLPPIGIDMPEQPIRYLPELASAMEYCGNDAIAIILPFLADPNQSGHVFLRKQIGSPTIYQYLEPKMIYVNPRYMQYLTRHQKGQAIKQFVTKPDAERAEVHPILDLMHLNFEAEPAVWDWLWQRLIYYGNVNSENDRPIDLNITRKPYDYQISDNLLFECMSSKDDRVRAMGQHIWRVMGKPLDDAVMQGWSNDPHFVIRANAVLLKPEQKLKNDPSYFVRLISILGGG